MKVAALLTVFNGLELLKPCIDNLRNQVDIIIIAWQDVSNKGVFSPLVEKSVRSFKDVELVYFEPRLTVNTKENERDKHNLLLNKAREVGASHYLFLATDHFYTDSDFNRGKEAVRMNSYDVTFTAMHTYYKHPDWKLRPIEDYYMPFICKLYDGTKIKEVKNYPVLVDPALQVNTYRNWWLFDINSVALHHYSKVRLDITDKYRNAAASVNWNDEKVSTFLNEFNNAKLGDEITYYGGRKLIQCDDIFNLRKYIE